MKTKRTLALLTMAALAGASLLAVAGQTAFETSALSKIALRHAGAACYDSEDLTTGCAIGWQGEGSSNGGLLPPTYFPNEDKVTVWRCNSVKPTKDKKMKTNAYPGTIDPGTIASEVCSPPINVKIAVDGQWWNANYEEKVGANATCGAYEKYTPPLVSQPCPRPSGE